MDPAPNPRKQIRANPPSCEQTMKKSLNYVDRKILHMLRMFGKGQAGRRADTGAAISADRAREIGVDMIKSPVAEEALRSGC